jgi:hypothetical protein
LSSGSLSVAEQEAPEHHVQRSRAELLIPHDDRLHRLWRGVGIGSEFEHQPVNVTHREGFGDALLVGSAPVTATHELILV